MSKDKNKEEMNKQLVILQDKKDKENIYNTYLVKRRINVKESN